MAQEGSPKPNPDLSLSRENLLLSSSGVPRQLRLWAERYLNTGHLDLLARVLVDLGEIDTPQGVLEFAHGLYGPDRPHQPGIYYSDLRGEGRSPWRKLKKLTDGQSEQAVRSHVTAGNHGVASHIALSGLSSGILPNYSWWHAATSAVEHQQPPPLPQQHKDSAQIIQVIAETASGLIKPGNRPHENLVADIASLRTDLLRAIASNNTGAIDSLTDELFPLLFPIYGELAARIQTYPGERAQQLRTPTFLNWATAVINIHSDPDRPNTLPLFTEIQMLDPKHGLKGNRADALCVESIGGRLPTSTELAVIEQMSRQRYRSVAQLHRLLETQFGTSVRLLIRDFKFDIGDNPHNREEPIILDDIKGHAMTPHVNQMLRYCLAAMLDVHLAKRSFNPRAWPGQTPISGGVIEYYLHTLPDAYRFMLQPSRGELREFFADKIVARWDHGIQRAHMRIVTNLVVGHAIRLLESRSASRGAFASQQLLSLDFDPHKHGRLAQLVDAHRDWLDDGHIVEICGKTKKGKPKLALHVGNLFEAIQSGRVKSRSFNMSRGGWITCPFPDHIDSDPSCHVRLGNGFHCFVCGKGGTINPASIPEGIIIQDIPATHSGRRRINQLFDADKIPNDHYESLESIQSLLEQEFRASPAVGYLMQERGIDPEIAAHYGAGYAQGTSTIRKLIANGFTAEQLIHYGVLFKDRNDKARATLTHMVTFPLTVGLRPTSVYGRAIGQVDKKFRHRKLSKQHSGIPHGIFNEQVLSNLAYDEVIIVEGILDALTLITRGVPNVVAIIGTNNHFALQQIIASGKKIAVALDNDKEGRRLSKRIRRELLPELGYTGETRNYTTDFLKQNIVLAAYKDFNAMHTSTRGDTWNI